MQLLAAGVEVRGAVAQVETERVASPDHHRRPGGEGSVELQLQVTELVELGAGHCGTAHIGGGRQPAPRGTARGFGGQHQGHVGVAQTGLHGRAIGPDRDRPALAADHQRACPGGVAVAELQGLLGPRLDEQIAAGAQHPGQVGAHGAAEPGDAVGRLDGEAAEAGGQRCLHIAAPAVELQRQLRGRDRQVAAGLQGDGASELQRMPAAAAAVVLEQQRPADAAEAGADPGQAQVATQVAGADLHGGDRVAVFTGRVGADRELAAEAAQAGQRDRPLVDQQVGALKPIAELDPLGRTAEACGHGGVDGPPQSVDRQGACGLQLHGITEALQLGLAGGYQCIAAGGGGAAAGAVIAWRGPGDHQTQRGVVDGDPRGAAADARLDAAAAQPQHGRGGVDLAGQAELQRRQWRRSARRQIHQAEAAGTAADGLQLHRPPRQQGREPGLQALQQGSAAEALQIEAGTADGSQLQHRAVGQLAIGQGQIKGLQRQQLQKRKVAGGEAAAKVNAVRAGSVGADAHLAAAHAGDRGHGVLQRAQQRTAAESAQIDHGAALAVEAQRQQRGPAGQGELLPFVALAAALQRGEAGRWGGGEGWGDGDQRYALAQGAAGKAQPVLADPLAGDLHHSAGAGEAAGDVVRGGGRSRQGRGQLGTAGAQGQGGCGVGAAAHAEAQRVGARHLLGEAQALLAGAGGAAGHLDPQVDGHVAGAAGSRGAQVACAGTAGGQHDRVDLLEEAAISCAAQGVVAGAQQLIEPAPQERQLGVDIAGVAHRGAAPAQAQTDQVVAGAGGAAQGFEHQLVGCGSGGAATADDAGAHLGGQCRIGRRIGRGAQRQTGDRLTRQAAPQPQREAGGAAAADLGGAGTQQLLQPALQGRSQGGIRQGQTAGLGVNRDLAAAIVKPVHPFAVAAAVAQLQQQGGVGGAAAIAHGADAGPRRRDGCDTDRRQGGGDAGLTLERKLAAQAHSPRQAHVEGARQPEGAAAVEGGGQLAAGAEPDDAADPGAAAHLARAQGGAVALALGVVAQIKSARALAKPHPGAIAGQLHGHVAGLDLPGLGAGLLVARCRAAEPLNAEGAAQAGAPHLHRAIDVDGKGGGVAIEAQAHPWGHLDGATAAAGGAVPVDHRAAGGQLAAAIEQAVDVQAGAADRLELQPPRQ